MKALLGAWIAALVVAAGWIGWDAWQGSQGRPTIGGPFTLTDQNGRTVSSDSLKGKPTLIYFGYTYCPDVCPTSLLLMENAVEKVGPDADKKVNMVFITIDPERDTPEILKDYLGSFDKRIIGLSGDRAALEPMLKAYRVYARKNPAANGEYSMDHSAIVYLLDKQMRFIGPLNIGDDDVALQELKKWL